MALVGNILWFIFGFGWLSGLLWLLAGIISFLTIIGIPFSIACFRLSRFVFFPFGKQLVDAQDVGEERIVGTTVANVIWFITCGVWLFVAHIFAGVAECLTILGIPLGLAHFKLALVTPFPLGKRIVSNEVAEAIRIRQAQQYAADHPALPYK